MAGYDNTLGAAFVGFAVACLLLGVLSTQVYSYFVRYTYDRPLYKALVLSVWILETFHSALTGHSVYHYAITNFADPFALLIPTWTLVIQVLVGAVISVLVKSAFAMRVWRFSHQNVVLTGVIAILNVAIIALAVIFTIKAFKITTFLDLSDLKWVTTAVLATSVFTDLVIAASLTYYLHHLRNAFSANTLVNGLIRYSLETGAITSICGIATLIAFDALPTTFVYMSFFFVLSKLYSNSLLATLNTRRVNRGKGTDRTPATIGDFTIVHTAGQVQTTHSIFGRVDWQKPTDIEVNVLQEIVSAPSDFDLRQVKSTTENSTRSASASAHAHDDRGNVIADSEVADRVRSPERAWF
ncbi:hypothetical protein M0805_008820 [Coniferiporia weirii]|nr:hypothetical protein M0805_008820 [Coniferiporia weirii]